MPFHTSQTDTDPGSSAATDHLAIRAEIDTVNALGHVTGWACVPAHPSERVKVSVHSGGTLLVEGLADLPRPDVAEAGFGDGNSGFALPLPARLFDGRGHRISLTAESPGIAQRAVEISFDLPRLSLPHAIARAEANALFHTIPLPPADANGESDAIYVPGQHVVCMRPYPLPFYHVRGWHAPEEGFTWIDGVEGTIEMLIRPPDDRYDLMLDVVPNGVGGRLQTLEVYFNGFRVGFFEVHGPARLNVELPGPLFVTRKARLNLLCENAVNVADLGVADQRRLGIAVCGWCIA